MYDPDRYWLGPSSWSQRKLSLLPFCKRFNHAAYKHDIAYGIGGRRDNKRHADMTFGCDMLKVCGWNPFAYFFAFIYDVAVVVFGIFYFNWHNEPLEDYKPSKPKAL